MCFRNNQPKDKKKKKKKSKYPIIKSETEHKTDYLTFGVRVGRLWTRKWL